MEKGHYGQYSGNARHSRVTSGNMAATKRDDEAHMEYLKEDVDYDNKHGHSDSSMTSDEKHISKIAGDLKYDEKRHGAGKHIDPNVNHPPKMGGLESELKGDQAINDKMTSQKNIDLGYSKNPSKIKNDIPHEAEDVGSQVYSFGKKVVNNMIDGVKQDAKTIFSSFKRSAEK